MTMNFQAVEKNGAELFGRDRLGRSSLRLLPQRVCPSLDPRPLHLVPRSGKRFLQPNVRNLKGLIPNTSPEGAELIFLGSIMGVSTMAVAKAVIGTASFVASWNQFTQMVFSLIG